MLAERLIDRRALDADPSLRSSSTSCRSACPRRRARRGRRRRAPALRGLGDDDEIVLWNGGLWPWLDPETAIRAVGAARRAPAAPSGSCSWEPRRSCPPSARPSGRGRSPPSSACSTASSSSTTSWVPYDAARRLAAGGRLRALHPRGPSRDALRLPHAPARLLLGAAADRLHGRRRPRRRGRAPRARRGDRAGRRRGRRDGARRGARRAASRPSSRALAEVAARYTWDAVVEPLRRQLAAPRAPRVARRAPSPGARRPQRPLPRGRGARSTSAGAPRLPPPVSARS